MKTSQNQHIALKHMALSMSNFNIFMIKKIVEQLILTRFNKQNV